MYIFIYSDINLMLFQNQLDQKKRQNTAGLLELTSILLCFSSKYLSSTDLFAVISTNFPVF